MSIAKIDHYDLCQECPKLEHLGPGLVLDLGVNHERLVLDTLSIIHIGHADGPNGIGN